MSRRSCDRPAWRPLLLGAAVALATWTSSSGSAAAQEATALEKLDPAAPGGAFCWVPSAGTSGWVAPSFAVVASYAHQPLVLVTEDANARRTVRREVVDHQVVLHALAAIDLVDRLTVDLAMPFVLSQGGDDPAAASFPSPEGAAVGDLRIGARGTVLAQKGVAPAAAIGAEVWVPSGDDSAYAGTGSTRFAPSIIVGAELEHMVWSAAVSRRLSTRESGALLGSDASLLVGVAGRFSIVQLGAELSLSTTTDNGAAFEPRSLHLETLASARASVGPVTFSLAGGPGFGRAPGTPLFRLLSGVEVGFDLVARPDASASDEGSEAMPHAGSGSQHGEPGKRAGSAIDDSDGDGDGVASPIDVCPELVGVPSGARPGCPADADSDGLSDLVDACPKQPGVASPEPTKNGCPLDSDGDGVLDSQDACVRDAGPPTADPKTSGCPSKVRVSEGQIAILEQVRFRIASAEIDPASFPLLEAVADALKANPAIARLAVDGHTDDRGAKAANVLLSQHRALSVVSWLVAHGTDARRVEARGFGSKQPIADNSSEAGRAKNRRVEFIILRRTELGERGWQEGTVDTNVEPVRAGSQQVAP